MKFLFVFAIVLLLGSLMGSAAQCICTADYSPVCGVNRQTYSNRCRLNCEKVKLAHTGAC